MSKGKIYLCATPIGNMGDITLRALEIMKQVDLIAAEDTRHTRKLLKQYNVTTPLTSYHRHNERQKAIYLLELLDGGKNIVLVSDAGMPGISDPGEYLVQQAIEHDIDVIPLPGPSAVVTALAISGFSTIPFVFEGFLPRKSKERRQKMARLAGERRTIIFFETPHRILATLKDMEQEWGRRRIAVCRELTKRFEEVLRGETAELRKHFEEVEPRGELCLVVEGAGEEDAKNTFTDDEILLQAERLKKEGWSTKDIAKDVALRNGLAKRDVYNLLVKQNK